MTRSGYGGGGAALDAARAVEVVGLQGAGSAERRAERAAEGAPDGVGRGRAHVKLAGGQASVSAGLAL